MEVKHPIPIGEAITQMNNSWSMSGQKTNYIPFELEYVIKNGEKRKATFIRKYRNQNKAFQPTGKQGDAYKRGLNNYEISLNKLTDQEGRGPYREVFIAAIISFNGHEIIH